MSTSPASDAIATGAPPSSTMAVSSTSSSNSEAERRQEGADLFAVSGSEGVDDPGPRPESRPLAAPDGIW
ncbi:MAG: hypothetical protein MZV70_67995 [Desulfobacterales bacterium]|nr:hypothetical protein [Desulfobacterales bacterium]